MKRTIVIMSVLCVVLLVASVCYADNMVFFEQANARGERFLTMIKCALRGWVGWAMILFGGLIALWEYFSTHQTRLLVIVLVGVIAISILSRVIPQYGPCPKKKVGMTLPQYQGQQTEEDPMLLAKNAIQSQFNFTS